MSSAEFEQDEGAFAVDDQVADPDDFDNDNFVDGGTRDDVCIYNTTWMVDLSIPLS